MSRVDPSQECLPSLKVKYDAVVAPAGMKLFEAVVGYHYLSPRSRVVGNENPLIGCPLPCSSFGVVITDQDDRVTGCTEPKFPVDKNGIVLREEVLDFLLVQTIVGKAVDVKPLPAGKFLDVVGRCPVRLLNPVSNHLFVHGFPVVGKDHGRTGRDACVVELLERCYPFNAMGNGQICFGELRIFDRWKRRAAQCHKHEERSEPFHTHHENFS